MVTQMVKSIPAMWETSHTGKIHPWVGKIPWRRKGLATTGILTWRIPWTEEPGGLFISFMNVWLKAI